VNMGKVGPTKTTGPRRKGRNVVGALYSSGDSPGGSVHSRTGILPSRKSKRLLFRNNQKAIADKKDEFVTESDTCGPYGRLVELIPSDMDRTNVLTKALFLGNLGLTFLNNHEDRVKNDDDDRDKKTENKTTIPRPKSKVTCLQNMCFNTLVQSMKRVQNEKEDEWFKNNKATAKSSDEDDDDDNWLNFGEYMSSLAESAERKKKEKQQKIPPLKLEDCVIQVVRCGTRITFSNSISLPENVQELLCTLKLDEESNKSFLKMEGQSAPEVQAHWIAWRDGIQAIDLDQLGSFVLRLPQRVNKARRRTKKTRGRGRLRVYKTKTVKRACTTQT